MTVNTQARDAIDTDIYRVIDYLSNAIADVDEVESRIANANKMIANTTDPDELEKLNAYKESLETEKSLRVTVMTEAFGNGTDHGGYNTEEAECCSGRSRYTL